MFRKAWGETDKWAEDLPHLSENQVGIEELHKTEYVAFGGAAGVPPASPLMGHQNDLPFAAAVLQAVAGAFLLVQRPRWAIPLQ
jgi:hypothetical protein